ncbi:MAG: hypothetical protein HYY84_18020 [Deltaproteobacteria bacterium]|nr:hypothetical protein [Deltaproteobacteria bacterium]
MRIQWGFKVVTSLFVLASSVAARAQDMAEPYKSWVEQYWGCKQDTLTFRVVCARTQVAQFCSGKYLAQLQAKGCGATAQGQKAISAAISCMSAAKMDSAPAQFKGPYENAHRLYWDIANAGFPGCDASKQAGTVVQATGCAGALGARSASGTQPFIASLAGQIDAYACKPPDGVTIGAAQQSAIDGAIGRAKALIVKAKGLGSMWLAASETACKAETELLAAKNICAGRVKQGEKEIVEQKDREKIAELRRKIAAERVKLQMVITDSNTLRKRAAECGYVVGNEKQFSESEECQYPGAPNEQRAKAEYDCVVKAIAFHTGEIVIAKLAIKRGGIRDSDDAKARVGCAVEDLVNATTDKLCEMFPTVCKIVRDGKACYRQAGDAVLSTVKDLALVTTVPWTLEGLRGLKDDVKKLQAAVQECWAWVKRSGKEIAKEAFRLLCEEPRGYLGQKWCPVLEQAGQCFRDAVNAGVARTAIAALERYAVGTGSATEDLVSGGDVGAVENAIARQRDDRRRRSVGEED